MVQLLYALKLWFFIMAILEVMTTFICCGVTSSIAEEIVVLVTECSKKAISFFSRIKIIISIYEKVMVDQSRRFTHTISEDCD